MSSPSSTTRLQMSVTLSMSKVKLSSSIWELADSVIHDLVSISLSTLSAVRALNALPTVAWTVQNEQEKGHPRLVISVLTPWYFV